jgi:DNA polymerase-3 subunit beta
MNTIELHRADWLRLLVPAAKVAPRKGVRPTSGAVRLDCRHGALTASASDDGIRVIDVSRPIDVAHELEALVDAHLLVERMKAMPDGAVTLAVEGSALVIKSKTRRFSLPTMPLVEWLVTEQPKAVDVFPLSVVLSLIGKVKHAVSADETRPHVNSVLVEYDAAHFRVVATDGHRLSVASAPCECSPMSILIPLATLPTLLSLEGAKTAMFGATGSRASLVVVDGDVRTALGFALVDATFPPWAQVIPKAKSGDRVQVGRAGFADAIDAVSKAASARAGGVSLSFVDGEARIKAEGPETGDGFDAVPCHGSTKTALSVNARYMLDALAQLDDADEVDLQIGGELDPLVVHGQSVTHVVMPMRAQ